MRIRLSTLNPILMLIHDVGEFGMLIVGIQAGPSCKWDLLLRCSTDRSVSTVLPLTDQPLYRLECFYHFFQRPNHTVNFDIETRCKIRNLKSSQQQRQTRPRNLCASTAKCRFRNVGAEGFQYAEDTRVWRKISRQCGAKTKDVPFVEMSSSGDLSAM